MPKFQVFQVSGELIKFLSSYHPDKLPHRKKTFLVMWPLWLVEMSLQHIQKNSPRLLPKPAKFEKNPPNGYRVIRKTKCRAGGAAGAAGAGSSPIHKQASLAGRLIIAARQLINHTQLFYKDCLLAIDKLQLFGIYLFIQLSCYICKFTFYG